MCDVEHDAKFRTFWPPPVKIRGRLGEINCRSFNYDGIHLMAIHCAAAERGVLIKDKESKQERKFMAKT